MIPRTVALCGLAFAGLVSLAAQSWQPTTLTDGQPDIAGYYQTTGNEGSGGLNIEPLPNMMNSGGTSPGIVLDPRATAGG